MEITNGMIEITWLLGPELWFGVRLGEWTLIALVPILLFLSRYVFAKQDWYKRLDERLNTDARLQQRLLYVMAVLLAPVMVYVIYLLVLQLVNGVRDNGFVWIPQGVLVFAAGVLLYAKGSLLLWKPLEKCRLPRNWREGYVGVFRDGLEFSIVGLLFGLATGDRLAMDEAAFGFGLFGIILSIIGEVIRCFRLLKRTDPAAQTTPPNDL